ncbi:MULTISPECIES: hypothetical protein [unclassified Duganella]|uniref:hypothetical protein n=1 Tax=unclassified Duganella TaxID=2636909 RepID=UPI000E34FDB6|nr:MULTISPECIES: hypothetical protein [unclassified Duganella]RFP18243.1 hypothetical protein D0T23_00010 [Duganella sp. BJB475]RFP34908.1 hypothetical protein D0T21_00010 [Duganella sp. BJB476]
MKKSIVALLPVILFAVFVPFLAATGIARSSGVLILSLGSPVAVLFSYFLFGKRDFQSALYGTALSLLLMACSTWVICLVRSAEFFMPDFSIQYISAIVAVALMAAVGEEFVFRGATVAFDVNHAGINDVVFLLAVGTGALVLAKFLQYSERRLLSARSQFLQPAKWHFAGTAPEAPKRVSEERRR